MDCMTLMQLLVPESNQLLKIRFQILRAIQRTQPIGRRGLAKQLDISERVLRSETDILKEQGLITYSAKGMLISELGKETYLGLTTIIQQCIEMTAFEKKVSKKLGIRFCKVVTESSTNKGMQISHQVQELMKWMLPVDQSIVTVTGGRTMAMVAEYFSKEILQQREISFVPARGGVGGSTLIQANSVSEKMAIKTGGEHFSLYVPEHVSKETYLPLLQEPLVSQTLTMMKQANCLLYSVGNASVMAERRGLLPQESQFIASRRAVGEAFGCFFDAKGKVVFKLPRVGLHLSDLESIPHGIAIVEGAQKAEALMAYAKLAPIDRTWFVIDESLANMVLNGVTR